VAHPPGSSAGGPNARDELVDALARLYAFVFGVTESDVRPAAVHRCQAMEISDRWVARGSRPDSPLLAVEQPPWSGRIRRCSLQSTAEPEAIGSGRSDGRLAVMIKPRLRPRWLIISLPPLRAMGMSRERRLATSPELAAAACEPCDSQRHPLRTGRLAGAARDPTPQSRLSQRAARPPASRGASRPGPVVHSAVRSGPPLTPKSTGQP
jgi:hypothetical protein